MEDLDKDRKDLGWFRAYNAEADRNSNPLEYLAVSGSKDGEEITVKVRVHMVRDQGSEEYEFRGPYEESIVSSKSVFT